VRLAAGLFQLKQVVLLLERLLCLPASKSGTIDCLTEALNIAHIGLARNEAMSRRSQLGKPSGPGDL